MSTMERYFSGECEAVWAELNCGVDRFGKPISTEDAEAVAWETMRRVRHNIEILIPRLTEMGYDFGNHWLKWPSERIGIPWFRGAHVPPDANIEEKIAFWEAKAGSIPLALKAFWREVGSVDLCGIMTHWPRSCHDPLMVWPIDEVFEYYEYSKYSHSGQPPYTFCASISVDDVMKYTPAGGADYFIDLPEALADPLLKIEPNRTTFVNYLRIAFEWGGFPGFKQLGYKDAPMEDIAKLREGLLSI
ncbi:hypothetical protein [Armatimonas rosea]|uniref:Uncharacterized protein n=1 Tax=Armatimonas rosea TaxID=685828 RepID=A0A7W9W6L8_ARMRO|nr:hypothetical protein [Armatimonas rosea]MBB6050718.1 hypothetical protein [Armatimonas rosea]